MKKNRWLLSVFCFLLMTMLLPINAYARTAIDTEHPVSLSVMCSHEGKMLENVKFDLYKVADIDKYGHFTLTDAFSEYAVSLEQESSAEWRALAGTLAQYARRDGILPEQQAITDQSGKASFSELNIGLYLVYGHRYTSDDLVYTPEAFLVSIPNLDENDNWVYDVEVNCKGEGYLSLPATTTVKVLKKWEDTGHESNRPKGIEVQLLRDNTIYETVVLNADNYWRYTWSGLSSDYQWSVVEKDVQDNYTLLISREGITYVLTNTYTPTFTTVEVEKIWDDKGHENKRPTAIEVQLIRDGEIYETVSLSASNGWKYLWEGLEAGRDWTIKEKSTPYGYTASIKQSGGKYTITNTYEPPSPPEGPKLPQTGLLWWPIPLSLCAGLVFYLLGFLCLKKRKADDHGKK